MRSFIESVLLVIGAECRCCENVVISKFPPSNPQDADPTSEVDPLDADPLEAGLPGCRLPPEADPPEACHVTCDACCEANPPVNRMTDRCKNITLPQTLFAGDNKTAYIF